MPTIITCPECGFTHDSRYFGVTAFEIECLECGTFWVDQVLMLILTPHL